MEHQIQTEVLAKPLTMEERIADLRVRKQRTLEMGGIEGLKRHHASGRLSVRERVALLVDEGSWFEIGAFGLPELRTSRHIPGDAVVTGFGLLDARRHDCVPQTRVAVIQVRSVEFGVRS